MYADHEQPMRAALTLARRNLGQTWPNPSVGAVLVKDGTVLAQGATARGGRPHAETIAIGQAGTKANGATLYVTLEPCSHQGQTPPCSQSVIDAGIRRVVVACGDPNPKVNGKGIAMLRAAGIEVIENICYDEAREVNCGFFSVMERGRPYISLKTATSLDGKIATASRESQWITSETAREYGHQLRSQYDAIITGIGTVLADDPQLTCRISGLEERSPVRIVLDSRLRLPTTSKLVATAGLVPLWVIHHPSVQNDTLKGAGAELLACPGDPRPSLETAVQLLAARGITRLLVEAGAELSTAFLQSGLVDRMYWFRAPLVIGDGGLAAFTGDLAPNLAEAMRWHLKDRVTLAPDSLDVLECSPAL